MKDNTLHKSATRGHVSHGWLESYQTFSFSGYYNPERMQFGALRVLNDDVVLGGKGFGLHPHDNMEIISIPLEGALQHKDNMGNTAVVKAGEVQVMSTGTGIFHSEYNYNQDEPAKFLQIWLFPNQLNVQPRYDQITLDATKQVNSLQTFITPNARVNQTWIHQNAWFSMGQFEKGKQETYVMHKRGNGVYFFVISGSFDVNNQKLESRDGLGVTNHQQITFSALEDNSTILIMEVPMIV